MGTKAPTETLAFRVKPDQESGVFGGYYTIKLELFKVQETESGRRELLGLGSCDWRDDLQVYAQTDRSHTNGDSYAWEVIAKPYQVTASSAKVLARELGAIEKRIYGWNDEWGYPTTFGQYLIRACKALGVTWVVSQRDGEYRFMAPKDGAYYVDHLFREYHRTGEAVA